MGGTYSGMLFELCDKIAGVQKATGFCDISNCFLCGMQQNLRAVDTIVGQVAVRCHAHNASEQADKVILGNRDTLNHIVDGDRLCIIVLDVIDRSSDVLGIHILFALVLCHQHILQQCVKNSVHMCGNFGTADNVIV